MGIAKLYQFFLFIFFLGAIALVIAVEKDEVAQVGEQQLSFYRQDIGNYDSWTGSGNALFDKLSTNNAIQFFQYIDDIDGSRSFTHGKFIADSSPVFSLFSSDLGDKRKVSGGWLQVKLDNQHILKNAMDTVLFASGAALAIYLLLAMGFAAIVMRQKRAISYAADYITTIPDLTFNPVEVSRLKGELRPLAHALNDCKVRLKSALDKITHENEQLNKVAYQDPVTGFGSRQSFTQKLASLSKDKKSQFGSVVMVKATELGAINQSAGRQAGDNYLEKVSHCIRKSATQYPDAEFYRISSGDFTVFIPQLIWTDSNKFLDGLKSQLDEYQQVLKTEAIAYIGLVPYQNGIDPINLITLADTAVSIAQTLGPNSYHKQDHVDEDSFVGDDRWKIAIDDMIKCRSLKFFQQPISPCRNDVRAYRELFARFYNNEGKFLPTTTVIAMAERHGLVMEIDKLVIVSAIRMLLDNVNLEGSFGINISPSSALNESFVAWLKDLLTKQRQIASRIVLEVNEAGMQTNVAACYRFVKDVHSTGARISIERFGMGFTSFKFFREVKPDYIKLDGSYTLGIEQDTNNQFFIRMIIDVARRIGIRVIATSVEQQTEKLALEDLLVDGLQGYYIAKPQPMTSVD